MREHSLRTEQMSGFVSKHSEKISTYNKPAQWAVNQLRVKLVHWPANFLVAIVSEEFEVAQPIRVLRLPSCCRWKFINKVWFRNWPYLMIAGSTRSWKQTNALTGLPGYRQFVLNIIEITTWFYHLYELFLLNMHQEEQKLALVWEIWLNQFHHAVEKYRN